MSVMLSSAKSDKRTYTHTLKLESFNTCVRKSYIDKTTRTSEQVIKLIQPNNKTPKEDLG